jgi:hypothetical protein
LIVVAEHPQSSRQIIAIIGKQLAMEYDPQSPFHAGSPKGAGAAMIHQFLASMEPLNRQTQQIATELAAAESR